MSGLLGTVGAVLLTLTVIASFDVVSDSFLFGAAVACLYGWWTLRSCRRHRARVEEIRRDR